MLAKRERRGAVDDCAPFASSAAEWLGDAKMSS